MQVAQASGHGNFRSQPMVFVAARKSDEGYMQDDFNAREERRLANLATLDDVLAVTFDSAMVRVSVNELPWHERLQTIQFIIRTTNHSVGYTSNGEQEDVLVDQSVILQAS